MKTQWLTRNGQGALTLVFGGWALGPSPFLGLTGRQDVLFVDDYRTLDNPLAELRDYDDVSLLAFSFGVASAAHWMARTGVRPARRVAVSGTFFPADARRGIAPEMIHATAQGLSPQSFARFCRRAGLAADTPAIDIDTARAELLAVIERGAAPETAFDRIWIPQRDRIIPTAAQILAWQGQEDAIRQVSGHHVPFLADQTWEAWLT